MERENSLTETPTVPLSHRGGSHIHPSQRHIDENISVRYSIDNKVLRTGIPYLMISMEGLSEPFLHVNTPELLMRLLSPLPTVLSRCPLLLMLSSVVVPLIIIAITL